MSATRVCEHSDMACYKPECKGGCARDRSAPAMSEALKTSDESAKLAQALDALEAYIAEPIRRDEHHHAREVRAGVYKRLETIRMRVIGALAAWNTRAAPSPLQGPLPETVRLRLLRRLREDRDSLWASHVNPTTGRVENADEMSHITEYDELIDALIGFEGAKVQGEAEGWLPMDTAPKDGTHILLAVIDTDNGFVGYVERGFFELVDEDEDDGPWDIRDGEPWCSYEGRSAGLYWCYSCGPNEFDSRGIRFLDYTDNSKFTHWMPLPKPPRSLADPKGKKQ